MTESEADTIVEDIVNGRVGAVNGQEPKDYRHVPAELQETPSKAV